MEQILAQIPQQLANGLTLGAVYALVALGYSLVFGVLRLLNFAHGDVYMIGAFGGYATLSLLTHPDVATLPAWLLIVLALAIAMLAGALLGALLERVAYRPLRGAPKLAALLSSLGAAFFLQNSMLLLASANHRAMPVERLIAPSLGVAIGGARLSATRLLVIGVALALMLALHLLVQRTRLGQTMRAIAADRDAALMLGIDVNRVTAYTFMISSALAGAAGALVGLVFTKIWHLMGFAAGLKGLTAAVIGGIGSMPGALLGGLTLGLADSLATGFISPTFADLLSFLLLIAMLLLRPSGLLGKAEPQKV